MFGVMAGVALCMGLTAIAAAQDGKIAQGKKLFADQKCVLCHSVGDKGNKKGPLDASPPNSRQTTSASGSSTPKA